MAGKIQKYTPQFIEEHMPKIFDTLMQGHSIRNALKAHNFDKNVFFRCVAENPLWSESYNRAQAVRAELLVDEAIDIADNSDDAMKARNQIDIRKWYASKILPHKFGEKIDVTITQNVDVKGAIEEAKKRVRVVTPTEPQPILIGGNSDNEEQ